MLGLSRKFQASVTAALLFYVISSPFTYRLVDQVVGTIVNAIVPQHIYVFKVSEDGSPTNFGLLLHAIVYGTITYHLMNGS
jgi:hypothetical protein